MSARRWLAFAGTAWLSVTVVWWALHPQEGFGQALVVSTLLVIAVALIVRWVQADSGRQWRLRHDLDHASERTDRESERERWSAELTAVHTDVLDVSSRLRNHCLDEARKRGGEPALPSWAGVPEQGDRRTS